MKRKKKNSFNNGKFPRVNLNPPNYGISDETAIIRVFEKYNDRNENASAFRIVYK